jgi:hypothetical protein
MKTKEELFNNNFFINEFPLLTKDINKIEEYLNSSYSFSNIMTLENNLDLTNKIYKSKNMQIRRYNMLKIPEYIK